MEQNQVYRRSELSTPRCAFCGGGVSQGHKYYFIKDAVFHLDCLQDNYSAKEILKLLGVMESTAKKGENICDPLYPGYVLLGPYKNVLVLSGFWDYFKRRFPFFSEVVRSLSQYKREKGIWFFSSDQDMLEKWAIMKLRK